MRIFSDGSKMPDELYVKFILGLVRALSEDENHEPIRISEYVSHKKLQSLSLQTPPDERLKIYENYNKATYQNLTYKTFMDELIRINTEKMFNIDDEIKVPAIVEEYIIKYTTGEKA